MKAQLLTKISPIEENPLELVDLPIPQPQQNEILIKVSSCGICKTDLDEAEGRALPPKLPIIPGHQIVGRIAELGSGVKKYKLGQRVGVGWIYKACGKCYHCQKGNENLCEYFQGTGFHVNGGYAEYVVVSENFAFTIPEKFSDSQTAPLMCAGSIGYRALKLTGMKDGETIALYGYGASNHLVHQIIKYKFPNSKVFVFTRKRNDAPSELAKKFGADWVGETGELPPEKFHYAIDTTPSKIVVQEALRNLEKGGKLILNLFRKEEKIELDYTAHLWQEKEIKSVANITRKDIQEFLSLAEKIPITPEIKEFKLEEANKALTLLKQGKYVGAGVLKIS